MSHNVRPLYGAIVASFLLLLGCEAEVDDNRFTGYIEAELIYVAAPDPGWLRSAPFKEGEAVAVGDVVFTLDDERQQAELTEANERLNQAQAQVRDMAKGARADELAALEAQLHEAQATLVFAKKERDRNVSLVKQGLVSKAQGDQDRADYDAALARVENIKANIKVALLSARDEAMQGAIDGSNAAAAVVSQVQWRLDQRSISAPVTGVVEEVFFRHGEYVKAASPVLAILPTDAMKVRFFVPQAQLSSVALGKTVDVVSDANQEKIRATISYISRTAEFTPPVIYSADSREKLVFLVEARVADEIPLRPGQPVDVLLP
ncbi:MAG: HlyD family efflux transporter periplasmic adaptor subunit [Pseudomonadales bacterium]